MIPCSGGKAGEVSGRLVPARVADFIGHESRRLLEEGQGLAFTDEPSVRTQRLSD